MKQLDKLKCASKKLTQGNSTVNLKSHQLSFRMEKLGGKTDIIETISSGI